MSRLLINMTLHGEQACGKTRATAAIKRVLAFDLPDKPYTVNWSHYIDGEGTECGTFTSEDK